MTASARALVIAIDGPAAAGKGTLARRIAAHCGLDYLDTGLIYRAVARRLLDAAADPADPTAALGAAEALDAADLDRPDLRDEAVGSAASVLAAIPAVRTALLGFQRRFAGHPPGGRGAVLDGRDIGTVVCPDAAVKLFVTASPEERAGRRYRELLARGAESIYARVLADVRARDERDGGRDVAPLRPASDAFVLDTTDLDADAAFASALQYVHSVLHPGQR
jgi:cytidylate kinase